MIKKILFTAFVLGSFMIANGQEKSGYQLPPEAIVAIIDAPQTPGVLVSPDNKTILLLDRAGSCIHSRAFRTGAASRRDQIQSRSRTARAAGSQSTDLFNEH